MAWIAGSRIVLRAWERDDVLAQWEAAQTADATGQRLRDWLEPPKSFVQREQEFEANQSEPDPTVVRMIIEADGRAVGDIDLFHIDQRSRNAVVGLGIWREEDRGRGFGTDALRTMLRWAFRHLNMHRIELSVEPDNGRAVRIYEKLGFVREGLRREHHFDDGCMRDELIMGLLDREFESADRAGGVRRWSFEVSDWRPAHGRGGCGRALTSAGRYTRGVARCEREQLAVEPVEHLLPNSPDQNRCALASPIEPKSVHLCAVSTAGPREPPYDWGLSSAIRGAQYRHLPMRRETLTLAVPFRKAPRDSRTRRLS